MNIDGVVKTLQLLRHCKFNVITTYFSTPHSIKFALLEYEAFYLAIQNVTFYEFMNIDGIVKTLHPESRRFTYLSHSSKLVFFGNEVFYDTINTEISGGRI